MRLESYKTWKVETIQGLQSAGWGRQDRLRTLGDPP